MGTVGDCKINFLEVGTKGRFEVDLQTFPIC
jgi:hypothetical protein